jgi:hypothetical protein
VAKLVATLADGSERPLTDGFGVVGWHIEAVAMEGLRSDGQVVPSSAAAALMRPRRSAKRRRVRLRRGR